MTERICGVTDCGKPCRCGRHVCEMHYYRMRRTGSYERARMWHRRTICSVDGCSAAETQGGMCPKHSARVRRHGDPHIVKTPPGQPMETNPAWRGDRVNYFSWHQRLQRMRGNAREYACVDCGGPAAQWSYDHDAPNEQIDRRSGLPYVTDADYYSPRCHSCHMQFDGVIEAASAARRRCEPRD